MMEREKEKRAKTILYLYRVLLTGIHVLRGGGIEANLRRLMEENPQDGVMDLIEAKTKEKAALADDLVASHQSSLERLREELDKAFAASSLPELPPKAEALDDFLVRLRLREGAIPLAINTRLIQSIAFSSWTNRTTQTHAPTSKAEQPFIKTNQTGATRFRAPRFCRTSMP